MDISEEKAIELSKEILDFTLGGKDANEKDKGDEDESQSDFKTRPDRKRKINLLKEEHDKIAIIRAAMKRDCPL